MRKIGAALLALTLLCAMAAGGAETALPAETEEAVSLAAQGETADGFVYEAYTDGTAVLKGYTGAETALVIPPELDGYALTVIGGWAFENRTALTAVTVPEGVTAIGNYAFCGCTGLTRVSLPESLASVGDCAFILCTALPELTLPAGLTAFGANPFAYCASLAALTLPEGSALTLEHGLLYDAATRTAVALLPALAEETLTLPRGCRTLGRYAVVGCGSLEVLDIPATVTTAEPYAVYHCTALRTVTATAALRRVGEGAFTWCDALTVSAPAGSALADYCAGAGIPFEAK